MLILELVEHQMIINVTNLQLIPMMPTIAVQTAPISIVLTSLQTIPNRFPSAELQTIMETMFVVELQEVLVLILVFGVAHFPHQISVLGILFVMRMLTTSAFAQKSTPL